MIKVNLMDNKTRSKSIIDWVTKNERAITGTAYILQLVAGLALIITVLIAGWKYILS